MIDTRPFGAGVYTAELQNAGKIIDGQPRKGICMLDSSGALLNVFHDQGIHTYEQSGWNFGSIDGIAPYGEDHYLIWGNYRGYSDGTLTDMDQWYVTRLHAGELNTSVAGDISPGGKEFSIHPNPTIGQVTFNFGKG